MMTKQSLFPPAGTPDVDPGQPGGMNVSVDETFAAAERIELDSIRGRDPVGGRRRHLW